MTKREMNLRIFRGEPVDHVLFQPRIEPWYDWHRHFNTLPERYRDMTLRDLYDDLDVSMRYVHYFTGMPDPVVATYAPEVVHLVEQSAPDRRREIFRTPHGDLVTIHHLTVDNVWRAAGLPVRTLDDLRALAWLYDRTEFHFSPGNFAEGDAYIGDRGLPQFWVPKSPYQALCQIWMTLEDFIYALMEHPKVVEDVMRRIDASYDPLYEELTAFGHLHLLNFGENIHASLLSPQYFEDYLIPFWDKRANQLRKGGIASYMHLDGHFRPLLPYLKDLPFDGLEALTPLPQGDVTLEEMRDAIGDKILLDGIPALLFMDDYSMEDVAECTEKLIAYFAPRLVLGISDEIPQGVGEQGIEKVRWIAGYCRSTTGP
jgi:hypothetical protein